MSAIPGHRIVSLGGSLIVDELVRNHETREALADGILAYWYANAPGPMVPMEDAYKLTVAALDAVLGPLEDNE